MGAVAAASTVRGAAPLRHESVPPNPRPRPHGLLGYALDSEDSATLSFASAMEFARSSSRLAGRPAFGLDADDLQALLDRYFPGSAAVFLTPTLRVALDRMAPADLETDEFADLVRLLLEFRADDSRESRWLAFAIAACCMGDDHLWQDLGLPSRQVLSDLLARWFPRLFAQNTGGMRWKKFLYKQLCERDGAFVCRSPSCAVCVEYANCFGPEEEGAWHLTKR